MKGAHSTHHEHMPKGHQQMGQWTPQRLVNWAESIGPATATLIATVIRERAHPQQAYRACLGILRLSKTYGDARLDKACQRALTLGTHRYRSIASILAKRLDERPITNAIDSSEILIHDNIRGANYYH
jgi:transposase